MRTNTRKGKLILPGDLAPNGTANDGLNAPSLASHLALTLDLVKVLSIPALTAFAYGIAYLRELGYAAGYGLPNELIDVDLFQIVGYGFVVVGVALFIGYVGILAYIARQGRFWNAVFWLAILMVLPSLSPIMNPVYSFLLYLLCLFYYQATRARTMRGMAWIVLSILVLILLLSLLLPPNLAVLMVGTILLAVVVVGILFWASSRQSALVMRGDSVGKGVRTLANLPNNIPAPARFPPPLIRLILAAALVVGILAGSFGYGYQKARTQDRFLVTEESSSSLAVVVRVYRNKIVKGRVDRKTMRLTGEWEVTSLGDSRSLRASYKQIGQLRRPFTR